MQMTILIVHRARQNEVEEQEAKSEVGEISYSMMFTFMAEMRSLFVNQAKEFNERFIGQSREFREGMKQIEEKLDQEIRKLQEDRDSRDRQIEMQFEEMGRRSEVQSKGINMRIGEIEVKLENRLEKYEESLDLQIEVVKEEIGGLMNDNLEFFRIEIGSKVGEVNTRVMAVENKLLDQTSPIILENELILETVNLKKEVDIDEIDNERVILDKKAKEVDDTWESDNDKIMNTRVKEEEIRGRIRKKVSINIRRKLVRPRSLKVRFDVKRKSRIKKKLGIGGKVKEHFRCSGKHHRRKMQEGLDNKAGKIAVKMKMFSSRPNQPDHLKRVGV